MISDDTSTISHVFGLAVLDNILLYSDWDTNTISMVDMASHFRTSHDTNTISMVDMASHIRTSLVSNLTRPTAIVLYQPDKLDGKNLLSLVVRKPVFGVSDLVRHKFGCTATEDGWRLEISDLESRGIVLSM